jgi:transposase
MAAGWLLSSARRGPCWPQTETGSGTVAAGGEGIAAGSPVAWLWYGSVDIATGSVRDGTRDGSALSPGPCVEDSGSDRLDAATASPASAGARPRKSAVLAEAEMAGSKKNARRRKAWIVFQDESGVSQRPSVRRTWAPKGETPVLIHAFNWKKLSICAALGYRWDGCRSRLWFQIRNGNYDSVSLMAFLEDLKRELRGQKATLVWDGLPAHKSRAMTDYLRGQRAWLTVERLPGYAPDLNPVETLWGNIKGQELANRCADNLDELDTEIHAGMGRVRRSSHLPFSFLEHAGLSF